MKKLLIVSMLLSLIAVNACSLESEQRLITEPVKKTKSSSKAHKPGASVNLVSPAIININANDIKKTNIVLSSPVQNGVMQVDISPGEGLQLPIKNLQSFDLSNEGKYVIPLEVLAASNGRFYVNLHIQLNDGEKSSSRNLAVVIQVGPITMAETVLRKAQENTDQEKIISMPAEEKITTK